MSKNKLVVILIIVFSMLLSGCDFNSEPDIIYDTTSAFLQADFLGSKWPDEWVYIPDVPDNSEPSWFENSEKSELKLELAGMGIQTPQFAPHDMVKVAIFIGETEDITKTNISDGKYTHIFDVGAYDSEGNLLESFYIDEISSHSVCEFQFNAKEISTVKIRMCGFYYLHNQKQALGIEKIALFGEPSIIIPPPDPLYVDATNITAANLPTYWNSSDTGATKRNCTLTLSDNKELNISFGGVWRTDDKMRIGGKDDILSYISVSGEAYIESIIIDYYQTETYNVYNNNSLIGYTAEGVQQPSTQNEGSLVMKYDIQSTVLSLSVEEADSYIYSITFIFG